MSEASFQPKALAPGWFSTGAPVADIQRRSGDAEFILDDDFEEEEGVSAAALDWRECLVPAAEFGPLSDSLDGHLMRLWRPFYGASWLDEERARCAAIRQWMSESGGADSALMQSPILATIRGGRLHIEDGFHRLGVAVFDFGAAHVRVLCAAMPQSRPQHQHGAKNRAAAPRQFRR